MLRRLIDIAVNHDSNVFTSSDDLEIWKRVKPYTMTSSKRVNALLKSVEYVVANELSGDFVECGVWRGGSAMAMALKLKALGVYDRKIYLYDTFAGMSTPSDFDRVYSTGESAVSLLQTSELRNTEKQFSRDVKAFASRSEVENNLLSIDYPKDNFHLVEGPVESTLLNHCPDQISLLRLDTDFYESTKIELQVLFPKLVNAGVLIIDDYGHWLGSRKAVDEYFHENSYRIFLHDIDYTGRLAIKSD